MIRSNMPSDLCLREASLLCHNLESQEIFANHTYVQERVVPARNYIGASSVYSFFPTPDAATHEREMLLL